MMKTIVVSRMQIDSAKAVIELAGGPEYVDPLIVKIAGAKPRKRTPKTGETA